MIDRHIDVEVENLKSLLRVLNDINDLRDKFSAILNEAKHVATAMGIHAEFPKKHRASLAAEASKF